MDFIKPLIVLTFLIISLNTCAKCTQSAVGLRRLLQINNYYFNNCPNREKEKMTRCESYYADDWDIYEGEKDLSSRSHCCYVWAQLKCKLKIARKCDNNYANQLERETEKQFQSVCYYHSRYSASCALRWWMIMLIVVGGLVLIAVAAFFIWRFYRNKYTSKYDY